MLGRFGQTLTNRLRIVDLTSVDSFSQLKFFTSEWNEGIHRFLLLDCLEIVSGEIEELWNLTSIVRNCYELSEIPKVFSLV